MVNNFAQHFNEIKKLAKEYIDLHLNLGKLESMEKLTGMIVILILAFIGLTFFSIIVFFLGLSFALWFGAAVGTTAQGALVFVAIILAIFALLVIFRKSLLINPMLKVFRGIFFDEHYVENDDIEQR